MIRLINKMVKVQYRPFSIFGLKNGKVNTEMTNKYTIVDHEYDAVVVGAGGAGL